MGGGVLELEYFLGGGLLELEDFIPLELSNFYNDSSSFYVTFEVYRFKT